MVTSGISKQRYWLEYGKFSGHNNRSLQLLRPHLLSDMFLTPQLPSIVSPLDSGWRI